VVLRYALARPGRVTHLVYVSGVGVDPEATWHDDFERNLLDRLGDHLERWRLLRARRPRSPPEEERERVALRLSAEFADRDRALAHAERETTPFLGDNDECNDALNADRRRSLDDGELLRSCQALKAPVLLVDGALDLRPRWAVDSLERALPSARRVVLPDGAHLPWVESPAAFRTAVTGFLSAGA
jgi:proline iminopeptidase